MSLQKNPSWLRCEAGVTVEHLGNKTSPGSSRQTESRRVAAGRAFGATHTVYITGVFVWRHDDFHDGLCVTAGNS